MDLIAGKKCYYRGRYVPEGEEFSAPRQYARPLLALKMAKRAPEIVARAYTPRTYTTRVMPRAATETVVMEADLPKRVDVVFEDAETELVNAISPTSTDMTELRREYAELVGKRPFHGWDEATLREKMAAAGDE